MWEMILSFILGAAIPFAKDWLNNKREDQRHQETILQKNNEAKKEESLRRLHNLLMPVMRVYIQSDENLGFYSVDEYEVHGKGLHSDSIKKIESVVENNFNLLTIELMESYFEVSETYQYDIRENPNLSNISSRQFYSERVEDFFFDDNRKFINLIKKEAKEIESKYK